MRHGHREITVKASTACSRHNWQGSCRAHVETLEWEARAGVHHVAGRRHALLVVSSGVGKFGPGQRTYEFVTTSTSRRKAVYQAPRNSSTTLKNSSGCVKISAWSAPSTMTS
jgi:hypothetical protein